MTVKTELTRIGMYTVNRKRHPLYLTTHEAAWYVISVGSVCLSVCMSNDSKALTWEVHIHTSGLSPENTGQVRI